MIAASTAPGPARATAREWTGLAVLALPSLLVSIDVSVMVLALPHMSAALGADSAQQLWIMDIYSFMLAGFMITMDTLGDRIGRRKLLMFGGAGFALASILAAFAPSAATLIAARAVLGLAGATMSLADFAAAAHLSALDFIGDVDWSLSASAKDWYARMKSRPSFRGVLADRVPGVVPPQHYLDLDF